MRRRRSSHERMRCTASYLMIFSRIIAGVAQSIRRSTRKPRLNQDENRWTKSASTAFRSSRRPIASRSCSRMRTSAAVPPGARLSRRNSSCRRGSAALWTAAAVEIARVGLPGGDRVVELLRLVTEARRQRLEEGDPRSGRQLRVAGQNIGGERDARGLAPSGQEFLAKLCDALRAVRRRRSTVPREIDQRAAALGDRGQQFAEERCVHSDRDPETDDESILTAWTSGDDACMTLALKRRYRTRCRMLGKQRSLQVARPRRLWTKEPRRVTGSAEMLLF